MSPLRRRLLALLAADPRRRCAAADAGACPATAVRVVVPHDAGLGPDIVARAVAQPVEVAWRRPVVVANEPGASGIVVRSAVRRAAPHGHTLFVGDAGSMVANPLIYRASVRRRRTSRR